MRSAAALHGQQLLGSPSPAAVVLELHQALAHPHLRQFGCVHAEPVASLALPGSHGLTLFGQRSRERMLRGVVCIAARWLEGEQRRHVR